MNISVTDIETGVIEKAVNVVYQASLANTVKITGYSVAGSGSQSTTTTTVTTNKSHNHE